MSYRSFHYKAGTIKTGMYTNAYTKKTAAADNPIMDSSSTLDAPYLHAIRSTCPRVQLFEPQGRRSYNRKSKYGNSAGYRNQHYY